MVASLESALARSPVVLLVGPRQCGKTTLARLLVHADSANYFHLEDQASLARLDERLTPPIRVALSDLGLARVAFMYPGTTRYPIGDAVDVDGFNLYYRALRPRVYWRWRLLMLGFDRITFDPNILGGKACIRGMRISVSLVVNLIANGMTAPQIVAEYPDLEEEDVAQALKYAAWIADDQFLPATETA
jgi:uncharacterized protein (DUF433 family)